MQTILADGGLYAFQIRAKEILDPNDPPPIGKNQLTVTTNVTIVVTDVDDLIPRFNHRNFTVAVPEDVGKCNRVFVTTVSKLWKRVIVFIIFLPMSCFICLNRNRYSFA